MGLNQLTWSNSSKCARLPGFAQSWARLPGFAKFWTRLPGPLNLHRARLPGSSNLRVRLPGFAKLWTRLPGKRNVRTRLPRPQFCKSGPGYLVDQITWSRPKVGQITWSRPVGRRGRVAGGHASGPLVCPPPRIVARNGRGISDSMATTHMQNG